MALNDRSLALVLRNVGRLENYRSLRRMLRVYHRPADAAMRYFLGRGRYPCRLSVRTPMGDVAPILHHGHDVITLNEVFCREDYAVGADTGLVVDIGSNIGISALYFLTRNATSRCILFEPDPRNVAKLRENLAGYEDRYELHEVAVAAEEGELPFFTEPFGRYGGLSRTEGTEITVRVRHLDDVLRAALDGATTIDVLKLDTEGSEPSTLLGTDPALLSRVGLIYYESFDAPIEVPGFIAETCCDTVRLQNVSLAS